MLLYLIILLISASQKAKDEAEDEFDILKQEWEAEKEYHDYVKV